MAVEFYLLDKKNSRRTFWLGKGLWEEHEATLVSATPTEFVRIFELIYEERIDRDRELACDLWAFVRSCADGVELRSDCQDHPDEVEPDRRGKNLIYVGSLWWPASELDSDPL